MHILFVHLSYISLENFKDCALIIPEILELIKLHTYKFGLVYFDLKYLSLLSHSMMISSDPDEIPRIKKIVGK